MKNALERNFKEGQYVYVVHYWYTNNGMQAFKTWAKIFEIDESKQVFSAFLYDDTYKVYSFKDYGRLIFDTSNEAEEAAERLPKPQTIVFQVIGKKVYKKIVIGIDEQYTDGVYDLLSYNEIEKTLNKYEEIDEPIFALSIKSFIFNAILLS